MVCRGCIVHIKKQRAQKDAQWSMCSPFGFEFADLLFNLLQKRNVVKGCIFHIKKQRAQKDERVSLEFLFRLEYSHNVSPRNMRSHSDQSANVGPASIKESLAWYGELLRRLPAVLQVAVRASTSRKICIATWYSGWDPVAFCLSKVMEALGAPHVAISVVQAADLDPSCLDLLQSHPSESQSQHVFDDFSKSMPVESRNLLIARREQAEFDFGELVESGVAPEQAKVHVEEALYSDAAVLTKHCSLLRSGYCHRHGGECPTWLQSIEGDRRAGHLCGAVFGSCCQDHSCMNQNHNHKVVSAYSFIPWVVLAHTLRCLDLDFIVEECTPQSERLVEFLMRFLGSHWQTATWNLCPSHFGFPQTRLRRWTVYRNQARNRWQSIPTPLQLFSCAPVLGGRAYWCAPNSIVASSLENARARRGHSGDISFTWMNALTPGQYELLLHHLRSDRVPVIVDVTQMVPRGQSFRYARCLTRASLMWSLADARPLLPVECLVQMGLPAMFEFGNGGDIDLHWALVISHTHLSGSRLQSIAGNAMHPVVCASVLLWLLASDVGQSLAAES